MDVLSSSPSGHHVTSEAWREPFNTDWFLGLTTIFAVVGVLAVYFGAWLVAATVGVALYAEFGATSPDFSDTYNRLWPNCALASVVVGLIVLVMILVAITKSPPKQ